MILVTGAGGKTGSTLIKTLSTIESVCAFVLREEQISEVEALGAHKAIAGDLRDASAIRSAMKGVRSVYHICPNMHTEELAIGRQVIGEARNSGAEHFVYHSVLHPQTEKMPHHWQKLRVEEVLFEAGLPFTILQPAPYMQNLLAGWKRILTDGFLRVPYSVERKFSFVDLEDVAQAASRVLTEPHHINATYELVGTLPMSHAQVAETLGRVLGRDIRARRQEIEEWKAGAASTSENAIERLVGMFEYYDQWGLTGNPNVLRWLLKREPVSLEAFFERMVQESNHAG
jgi:uncharacterized protein YbjT (DUF2867 family)